MASLFIEDSEGRKQYTAEQLCELFSIDYKKILKNPLFKNNKNKRSTRNYLGSQAGSSILPYFNVKHPETGKEVKVRYAESWQADKVNKNLFTYTPFRVRFYGEKFRFDDNEELAVWFALNKVARSGSKYEFVDVIKEAKDKINNIDNLEKALLLSRKVEDSELPILLKGLSRYLPGYVSNVDNMELDEQRALFKQIAAEKPAEFLAKVQESASAKVEGTILQLVDRGGIVLMPSGPFRVWKWAAGPSIGKEIGDVIRDFSSDTISLLVREIMSKPEEYKEVLVKTLERVYADNDIKNNSEAWSGFDISTVKSAVSDIVDKNDLAQSSSEISTKTTLLMEVPEATMESVRSFFDTHGYSKVTSDVSLMRKSIEDGVITSETIETWCIQNLKGSKK